MTLKVVLRTSPIKRPPSAAASLTLQTAEDRDALYKSYQSPGSLRVHAGACHYLKSQTHGLSDPLPLAPTFLAFLTSPSLHLSLHMSSGAVWSRCTRKSTQQRNINMEIHKDDKKYIFKKVKKYPKRLEKWLHG